MVYYVHYMINQKVEKEAPPERLSPTPEVERSAPDLDRRQETIPTEQSRAELLPEVPATVSTQPAAARASAKSPLLLNVEKILEEDLEQVYFSMQPVEQAAFKERGDAVAKDIEGLIGKARATAERIIALIRSWLQMVPGVSRFFIEQESKIKTDRLLALQRKKH